MQLVKLQILLLVKQTTPQDLVYNTMGGTTFTDYFMATEIIISTAIFICCKIIFLPEGVDVKDDVHNQLKLRTHYWLAL